MAKQKKNTNSNVKVGDINGKGEKGEFCVPPPVIYDEYEYFKALCYNAIKITNINYPQEYLFKHRIIDSNYIVYDNYRKKFLRGMPFNTELRENPLPNKAQIFLNNGQFRYVDLSYEPDGGFYLIKGLPTETTFADIIKKTTNILKECDLSIMQNLRAIRSGNLIRCSPELRLSILHAIQKQQCGYPVVVGSEEVINSLQGVDLKMPFIANDLYEFRQKERDALFNQLGTMSANVNKRERVQVGEVNATVGQCEDSLYTLIDNVNEQFKSYGINHTIEINNSLEELYTVNNPPASETNAGAGNNNGSV